MEITTETTVDEVPESVTTKKSRRGVARYEVNPFIGKASENTKIGTRRITNRTGEKMMIVSQETGEIIAPAGFHEVMEVDKTQFVKLYINGVKAFKGLKAAGTSVFEVIYNTVQENFSKDELYLHYQSINQAITPMSEATFYRGMKEMIEKGFIAESTRPGVYFLNIDFMFSGNKLAFIREYRLKSTQVKAKPDAIQLEEAGQQRLIE